MPDLMLPCTGKLKLPEYRQTPEFTAAMGSPVLLPWLDLVLIVQTGWSVPSGYGGLLSTNDLLSTYRATVGFRNLGADGAQLWVTWSASDQRGGVQRSCAWLIAAEAPELFDVGLDRFLDARRGVMVGAPIDPTTGEVGEVYAYPWYSTRLVRALRVYER